MELKNAVAVVTGGGRGMGRAIALALAEKGADVAVASRTLSELEEVGKKIESMGRKALLVKTDLSSEEDINNLTDTVLAEFGRVDCLVNNAGMVYGKDIIDTSTEEWDFLMKVNLRAVFLCTKLFLGQMIKRKAGVIINIASNYGLRGMANNSAYCASKFGVIGFTESLSDEVRKHGIKVHVICPGDVDTKMGRDTNPDGAAFEEFAQPEDIASAAVFLATLPPHAVVDRIVVRATTELDGVYLRSL